MSGSSSGLGEDSGQEQVRFWESDQQNLWGQEELTNHGFIDRPLVYPEVWTDFAVSSGCVFPIKTLSKSKARRWRYVCTYLWLLPAQKKTTAGRRTRFFFCKFVCSGSTGDPIYQCQKGYRFTCMALFQQNQPIELSTRTVHAWWRWRNPAEKVTDFRTKRTELACIQGVCVPPLVMWLGTCTTLQWAELMRTAGSPGLSPCSSTLWELRGATLAAGSLNLRSNYSQ